jgi:hypothetical protein
LLGLRSTRKEPGFSRVRVRPSREGPAAKAASVAEARMRRSPAAESASVAAAVALSPSYRPFSVAFISDDDKVLLPRIPRSLRRRSRLQQPPSFLALINSATATAGFGRTRKKRVL